MPFYRIVQALNPVRSNGSNPFFQTVVQILPEAQLHGSATKAADLLLEDVEPGIAVVDLWMNLSTTSEGTFSGHLMYDTALFEDENADGLVHVFISVLSSAVALPDTVLSSISLFPASDVDESMPVHADIPSCEMSLEAVLDSLGLDHHIQDFVDEGFTDLDDLKSLPKPELLDVLFELGLDATEADVFIEWFRRASKRGTE